jgi:hypothetical protein
MEVSTGATRLADLSSIVRRPGLVEALDTSKGDLEIAPTPERIEDQ